MERRDLGRLFVINKTVNVAVAWRMSRLTDRWLEVRVCLRKQKTALQQTEIKAIGVAYCVVKGLGLSNGYYRVPSAALIKELIERDGLVVERTQFVYCRYVHKNGVPVDQSLPVTALSDFKLYRRRHYDVDVIVDLTVGA
jgi:hypothetical protein